MVPDGFIITTYKYTSIAEPNIRSPAISLSRNQDPPCSRIIRSKTIQVSTSTCFQGAIPCLLFDLFLDVEIKLKRDNKRRQHMPMQHSPLRMQPNATECFAIKLVRVVMSPADVRVEIDNLADTVTTQNKRKCFWVYRSPCSPYAVYTVPFE